MIPVIFIYGNGNGRSFIIHMTVIIHDAAPYSADDSVSVFRYQTEIILLPAKICNIYLQLRSVYGIRSFESL